MNPQAETAETVDALPAFKPPATMGEVWDANWQAAGFATPMGVQQPRQDAVNDLIDAYQRASGKSLFDAARDAGMPLSSWGYNNGRAIGALHASDQAELTGVAQTLASRLPDAQARQVEPFLDVDARADQKAQSFEAQTAAVADRTYGLSGWGVAHAAELARGMADPSSVGLMFLGGPEAGAIPGMLAREFALNAGYGATLHIATAPERERLGLQNGSLAGDALQAGVYGAGLSLLLRGAAWTLRRAFGRDAGEPPPGYTPHGSPAPELLDAAGALAPEDFEAAARHQDRETAMDALAPDQTFEGRAQARQATDAAAASIETGPAETSSASSVAPKVSPPADTGDVEATIAAWKDQAPFKTLPELFEASPANQARLVEVGRKVADEIGSTFVDPGMKTADSAERKFATKRYGSAGHMTDVVRGGISVDTPERADAAIAALGKHFQLVDEGWATTPAGYSDRKVIVRFANGQLGEIQFWHPELFDAKENGGGHKLYEEWRSLPLDDPRRAELANKMRELYASVLSRLPGSWKDVSGSGATEGNLRANSALDNTLADMPTSASSTRSHLSEMNAQASPADQTQGRPSQEQNVRAAIDPNIAADAKNSNSPGAAVEALARSDVPTYSQAKTLPAGAGAPAGVFMFDPRQLHVDASRFQFKSGGDQYGVTGALRSVSKWDPAKAQAIIVWEDAEGKLWVADGHQRAGLARRLTVEGKADNIQLPGLLYREADGFTAEDVRAIAAVTNIANGSGSAIDGAKVLRSRPELLDGSLPLTAGKGQQAAALARLGDEAFAMTINGVVAEHYAAVVGELIPSDPARQVAALKAIARFKPRNVDEASVLTQRVAQAELSRADEGRQMSMFGDLETAESTAGQEMRIVGAAIGELKRDKTLFARVVDNADRIEGSGSTIDRDASRTRAADAEVFAKTLASDAYSAGSVRDALTAAARDLRDGKSTLPDAVERVLAALRGKIEADGANGARDRSGAGGEPGKGAAGQGAAGRRPDASGGDLPAEIAPAEPTLAAQRADVERGLAAAETAGEELHFMAADGTQVSAREALSAVDEFKAAAKELGACILKFGE